MLVDVIPLVGESARDLNRPLGPLVHSPVGPGAELSSTVVAMLDFRGSNIQQSPVLPMASHWLDRVAH